MATPSYQPWYTGMLAPLWTCPLTTDSGADVNLTGISPSSISLLFKNISSGAETTGTGTFVITQAVGNGPNNPATVTYQPSSADMTATATTNFSLWILVTYSNGVSEYGPVSFTLTLK